MDLQKHPIFTHSVEKAGRAFPKAGKLDLLSKALNCEKADFLGVNNE